MEGRKGIKFYQPAYIFFLCPHIDGTGAYIPVVFALSVCFCLCLQKTLSSRFSCLAPVSNCILCSVLPWFTLSVKANSYCSKDVKRTFQTPSKFHVLAAFQIKLMPFLVVNGNRSLKFFKSLTLYIMVIYLYWHCWPTWSHLTHSHTMTPFDASGKQAFWKHWEKEKLLVMSNFSFSHSVFYPFG